MRAEKRIDRNVKLPCHTRAVVPEFWLVDLRDVTVERHNAPCESGYRRTEKERTGEESASEALPGLLVPANTALGK